MSGSILASSPYRNGTAASSSAGPATAPPAVQPALKPTLSGLKSPMDPNVQAVVLDNLLIRAWYPSFYPDELVGASTERLYVCRWCFRYSRQLMKFLDHVVSLLASRLYGAPSSLEAQWPSIKQDINR
jgi:hypothetical protein